MALAKGTIVHAESRGLSGFYKDRRPELILQKRLP